MTSAPEIRLRPMRRSELDTAISWAASEGWNPGLNDAELFWSADPHGFVAADLDGQMIGSASVVSYDDGRFGFLGLFIVPPEYRGHGVGRLFWENRDSLCERLRPDAARGIDGVVAMEGMYAEGGFTKSHRMLRMTGTAQRFPSSKSTIPIDNEQALEAALALDLECFGFNRNAFMRSWIRQPGAVALQSVDSHGNLRGFAVARPCLSGFKIAPVFAIDTEAATDLIHDLSTATAGSKISLDVPEPNEPALDLAREMNLMLSFECARMYQGDPPDLAWNKIFAMTSPELG